MTTKVSHEGHDDHERLATKGTMTTKVSHEGHDDHEGFVIFVIFVA